VFLFKEEFNLSKFLFLQLALNVATIGMFTGIGLILLGLSVIILGIFLTKNHKWCNEQKTEGYH